ncbi:hypothetical protein SeLEV6574_g03880 [Synchytrium endobioticum]|nr:hypothetical protein SeLEV6574_g03880 [Synchytrium endobioticum]
MYCSDDCRSSNLSSHLRECGRKCLYDLDEMARLSIRLVDQLSVSEARMNPTKILAMRGKRIPGCGPTGVYFGDSTSMLSLMPYLDRCTPHLRKQFDIESALICAQLHDMDHRQLIWARGVLHNNSFSIKHTISSDSNGIVECTDAKVGVGVYVHASLINHSCTPNSVVEFIGSRIQVRAAQTIAAGDEVTISYGPLAARQSKSERQEYFDQTWAFKCHRCTTCGSSIFLSDVRCSNCSTPVSENAIRKDMSVAESLWRQSQNATNPKQSIALLKACCAMQMKLFHNATSLELGRTFDALAETYAREGYFEEAGKWCFKSLDILGRVYGETSIEYTRELPKLCSLLFQYAPTADTLCWVDKATKLYKQHFSSHNQDLMQLLQMKEVLS